MAQERICILGTGQMGVTCATLLAHNRHRVVLLGLPEAVEILRRTGESPHIGLFELGLAAAGIGLCGLALTAALRAAPVVPTGDPQLSQSLHYHS